MPMPMPPAGGLPGPLAQASPNAGAMTQQQGNHGNIQAATVKIRAAMKMLEEALPLVPMGNEIHTDVLDALKKFTKHVKQDSGSSQQESASLQSAAQNVAKQAPMANMARMFGAGQGGGQPPAQEQAA